MVYTNHMNRSTAAHIINKNQLLLLLRDNKATISDPNKWDVPGGSCEVGETYEQCLIRELVEELELHLTEERCTYLWESITLRGNLEHSFLIRITDREKDALILHEGQNMRFFTFEKLDALEFTRHLQNIINLKKEKIEELLLVPTDYS